MLLRRAAAAFMRTKPSGRMEARSLRRMLPVMRFHRRIRRRSMYLIVERECLGLVGNVMQGRLFFWVGQSETRFSEDGCLPRALLAEDGGKAGGDGRWRRENDNWASHYGYGYVCEKVGKKSSRGGRWS